MPHSFKQQIKNSFVNNWSQQQQQQQQAQQQQTQQQQQQQQTLNHDSNRSHIIGSSGSASAPTTPNYLQPVKREFFPDKGDARYMQPVKREFFSENSEPNTSK